MAFIGELDATVRSGLVTLAQEHGYALEHSTSYASSAPGSAHLALALFDANSSATLKGWMQSIRTHSPQVVLIAVGPRRANLILENLRAGADSYLPLPLTAKEFARTLLHGTAVVDRQRVLRDETISGYIHTQSLSLMSRMAAHMAHEINNPLTPILGLAELLQADATPNTSLALALNTIIASALRISRVLQNLLSFTRPVSLREQIDLRELVSETLQTSSETLADQQINVELHLPATPILVLVGIAPLRQAIFALIDHACTSMPQGGTVKIAATSHPQQSLAELFISDTGAPIAAYHHAHLFEPFYSHTVPGIGVGPGLAVARHILRLHGGDIAFQPTEQGENSFRITLPLA